jgi:hypothetical protein
MTKQQERAMRTIRSHVDLGAIGLARLALLRSGLIAEIARPGSRPTRKAPRPSTILRREFGLSGKPAALLAQYDELLTQLQAPLDSVDPVEVVS